jgi:hypothetical protein
MAMDCEEIDGLGGPNVAVRAAKGKSPIFFRFSQSVIKPRSYVVGGLRDVRKTAWARWSSTCISTLSNSGPHEVVYYILSTFPNLHEFLPPSLLSCCSLFYAKDHQSFE